MKSRVIRPLKIRLMIQFFYQRGCTVFTDQSVTGKYNVTRCFTEVFSKGISLFNKGKN